MALSVVYINGAGSMIGEIRNGAVSDYLSDSQGSLIGIVDENGNQAYSAEYWPFGEVAASSGVNPTFWGYIGLLGYFKDSAQRLYVRARHLRVDLGRWLTQDPLWPAQKAYGYVGNRPHEAVDPSGLSWFGSLLQCGVGGGLSYLLELLGSWSSGQGSGHQQGCQAAVGCASALISAAVVSALVATGVGALLVGCIGGLVGALSGALGEYLCGKLPYKTCIPEPYNSHPWYCILTGIVVGTVAGCAGGLISGATIKQGLEEAVMGILGSLGYSVSANYCTGFTI